LQEASVRVTDTLINEITSEDGAHRILIVRRPDGLYSYRHVQDDLPEIAGVPGPYCGVYDTAETAGREARARVPWLRRISN
jgi:hypothetical protein